MSSSDVPGEAPATPPPSADDAPAPASRGRRCLRRAGELALVLLILAACVHRLFLGAEPGIEPSTQATPAAPSDVGQPMQAGEDADGDSLDDALEAAIALRHAPRYRFAAHDPACPDVPQNKAEEFFPLSVSRFFAAFDAGLYELVGGERVKTAPGTFGDGWLVRGYPSRLAGDVPGRSTLYSHVYPAAESGEAFVEYWVFYGYDRADASALGLNVPYGAHRGDWEHTAYRVRLDPPELLEGYYYGHGSCLLVPGKDLERVEGTHPLVYVSQGKHASYPQACHLRSTPLPEPLVRHLDVANGKGATWDAWKSPLVDLGERDRPRPEVERWLGFRGRWGGDGLSSPTGPIMKSSWRNNAAGVAWREHLDARGGVLLGR